MSMPFYVPPEQLIKDRAEFAQKGIARGKSIIAVEYDAGVLMLAENSSRALNKISELYDQIAFAGVGKYNEFESLRVAGIRHADMKGYAYGRSDVTGKSLASAYSQTLGAMFTESVKPYEIEILIAEIGEERADTRLFRIRYDGTLIDESKYCAIGGREDDLGVKMGEVYQEGWSMETALAATAGVFEAIEEKTIGPEDWEAAVLDRSNGRRAFKRLTTEEIAAARAAS